MALSRVRNFRKFSAWHHRTYSNLTKNVVDVGEIRNWLSIIFFLRATVGSDDKPILDSPRPEQNVISCRQQKPLPGQVSHHLDQTGWLLKGCFGSPTVTRKRGRERPTPITAREVRRSFQASNANRSTRPRPSQSSIVACEYCSQSNPKSIPGSALKVNRRQKVRRISTRPRETSWPRKPRPRTP